MTRRRRLTRQQRLDLVYARVPDIECVGRCWDSCTGGLSLTPVERTRIETRQGVEITGGSGLCPALTILNRCKIHADRPLICRLWGVVESLPCPEGCTPVGGYLTDREAYELIADVWDIEGWTQEAARVRAALGDPRLLAALRVVQQRRAVADEVAYRRQVSTPGALFSRGGSGHLSTTPTAKGRPRPAGNTPHGGDINS